MLCRIRTGNVHSLRHLSTFVSKHYVADPTEISNLITVALKSEYRRNGNGEFEIKECTDIICSRPNKSKPDNTWKFLIREDGSYYCHRCSKGGSWFDLKKRVFQIEKFVDNSPTEVSDDNPSVDDIPSVLPDQDEAFRHTSLLFPLSNHPPSEDRKKALAYLTEVRKLLPAVLMRYGVGIANQKFLGDSEIWEETLCVTFPWIVVKESQVLTQVTSCCILHICIVCSCFLVNNNKSQVQVLSPLVCSFCIPDTTISLGLLHPKENRGFYLKVENGAFLVGIQSNHNTLQSSSPKGSTMPWRWPRL